MVSASSSKFVVGTVEACAPELGSKSIGGMGCDDPLRSKALLLGSRSSEAESVAQHGTAAASQSHTMLSMVQPTGRGSTARGSSLSPRFYSPKCLAQAGQVFRGRRSLRCGCLARREAPYRYLLAIWYV